MNPQSIEQIMEEFGGFMVEEYGQWKVGRAETKKFILSSLQPLLLEAEQLIKPEVTREETGNSNPVQQTLIMQGYKMAIADCKQVLRNMRGATNKQE